MIWPTPIDLNSFEINYPFMISLNRFNGSFNFVNDLNICFQ